MILDLFIGALLGYVAYTYGLGAGLFLFVFFLILNPRMKKRTGPKIPNQQKLFQQIASVQVEKYSDNIIGTYKDNPIHEYIVVKNPANGSSQRYVYDDIILYNKRGQITVLPKQDEVFLASGLVYKLAPSVNTYA